MDMEIIHEDIVIVGAGLAGLTTALGLYRLGVRSLVLESADSLRLTGFALTLWPNGWRALDAVGIGDNLRGKSIRILGYKVASRDSNVQNSEADVNFVKSEVRCVRRRDLLETLESELPQGTIRYSSKVDSIDESDNFKLIHLSDGSVVRTKVLIGCDGVNSKVAKCLGLESPVSTGRSSIRGIVDYPDGHGFEPKVHTYFGGDDESDPNPWTMKQFVLNSIRTAPQHVLHVVESTKPDCFSYAAIKFRSPWNVLFGNIVKRNVCVAGDALHPMPPYTSQGGGSALEDGVVLARCLGMKEGDDDEEYLKMGNGVMMRRYSQERRWRSFSLISITCLVGWIQGSDSKVMGFLRKKFLARLALAAMARMAGFDCGDLLSS
ncbi:3-hydroxybenzoate 6-hydroxylase 1 [Phtheirospermum japonicum]|uniref:3-hydroxybenzoate 6-hydroxylase 1 n=1 Tax=Phtheirospermum japonicum TaxID=374723 RepID=A0A830CDP7_9LAMI|nr:3-hydroxybenzoate 6-hydroxylase 1 [Phtheirospermum japonicum]